MTRAALLRTVTLAAVVGLVLAARLEGFPWEVALGVCLTAAWRLVGGSDGRGLLKRRYRLPLEALALVLGVVLLHRLAVGDPQPLIALLVVLALLQGLALLRPQSPFTAFVLVLFSTIHASGAAFLRQDPPALLLTAGYLVLLTWALVLFECDAASRRPERTTGSIRRLRVGRASGLPRGAVVRTVAGLCVLGFLGGSVLYLVVPRRPPEQDVKEEDRPARMGPAEEVDAPATDVESFAAGAGQGQTTGVRLGEIGTIKLDLTPWFLVTLPPGRRPWLRESTCDEWRIDEEGGFWRASGEPEKSVVEVMYPGVGGWMEMGREDDPVRGYGVRIQIYRGPHKKVYLERDPVRVRVLRRTNQPLRTVLRRHANEEIRSYFPLEAGHVVEERVVPPISDPNALEAARSDATVAPNESYVLLPPQCEPIRTLAQQVVGNETNPWRRARKLESWLKGDAFTYTLKMPRVDKQRPHVTFLLEKRTGHCEYFAGSLVLLLRSLGHPARYVKGFRGGDWLKESGKWMVRSLHYHAWCEIYLAGIGWTPLDPTPPDHEAADADRSVTRAADRPSAEDEANLADRFLGYSREDRAALRAAIGRFLDRYLVGPLAFAFGRDGYWFGWGLVVLGLVALTRRHRTARVARAIGVPRRSLPGGPYGRALSILARKGLKRRPSQTAAEFERAVSRMMPAAAPPFEWLTRFYELERFGGRRPGKVEAREARIAIVELEGAAAERPDRRRR